MQEKNDMIMKKINAEMQKISTKKMMVKGTVYKVYRKCGYKNCKCAKGERHEGYQLNYKGENNITKTVYVKKKDVPEVKKLIKNYRGAKKKFNNIVELNIQLLRGSK